jgi:DNA-binding CsgD family transcriptional regulator
VLDRTNPLPTRDVERALTPRELEVLELASLGLTNVSLAERLGVTVSAVKFHLASIYRKLSVSNRTEAVALYLRSGSSFDAQAAPGRNGWT